jgi:hypothetical protein
LPIQQQSSIFADMALYSNEISANIDWYEKLVELGNFVFLIESKTRKKANKS